MGGNVVCQPGYVAEEAVAAATDGLGDGRETSGRGNLNPAALASLALTTQPQFTIAKKRFKKPNSMGFIGEWGG